MALILIIDDEESDRMLLEGILTNAGHGVFSASEGEQALRRLLEGGIDLVITDLQMPDVHGFELISILRDLAEETPPVIAVSGTGDFQLHMAGQLGATVTLRKPIEAPRLLQAVQDALGEMSISDPPIPT
jgi:CheY-like chemotaxis protein